MKYLISVLLGVAVGAVIGNSAWATTVTTPEPIPAGDVVTLTLPDQSSENDTGIMIWNQSDSAGSVILEYLSENEPGDVEGGFLLLDGTLRVTLDGIGPGEFQMLVIRECPSTPLRARPRLKKARIIRRKRVDIGGPVWRLARPRQARLREVQLRAAPRNAMSRKRRMLGQCGYDLDGNYAWVVVDQASDFAMGLEFVPEPSTGLLLVGAGGTLLAGYSWQRRRRRR